MYFILVIYTNNPHTFFDAARLVDLQNLSDSEFNIFRKYCEKSIVNLLYQLL